MSKQKTPGAAIAEKLAKAEAKGAELNGPQRHAAEAHRIAEQVKRSQKG